MDYTKLPFRELYKAIGANPPDTPHYIRAKTELTRRLATIGLILTAIGLAFTIIWHYLPN